jgi:hypothetical protein
MWPRTIIVMQLPDLLDPDGGRNRITMLQNKILKDAMRQALVQDWRRRVSEHFRLRAKAKYHHYARSPKTIARKKRKGFTIPDLVKTGNLRRVFKAAKPRITIRGGLLSSNIVAKSIMKFPSKMKTRRSARGVTMQKMADELGRWTQQEKDDTVKIVGELYAQMFKEELAKRPRFRKKFGHKF